jgi:hypothetical protein
MVRSLLPTLRPILFAGALLGAFAPGAGAQSTADERVALELERTDRALENAGQVVGESRSERATQLLGQGRRIQDRAWQSYRESRLVLAGRLTLEARRFAVRAVGFARSDGSLEGRARRELEVADTMLRSAFEEMAGARNDASIRLLEEARAQIDRGRRQLGEQHFEASLRLALSAERIVRQALELNSGEGGPGRAERELERTDASLERARASAQGSNDAEAVLLLERAVELQGSAWEAFRAGQPRVAVAHTREARSLASRVSLRVTGSFSAERVAHEIETTSLAIEHAQGAIESSSAAAAASILETSRTHQARATELLGTGDFRRALAQTLVARRLASRALELAQGSGR